MGKEKVNILGGKSGGRKELVIIFEGAVKGGWVGVQCDQLRGGKGGEFRISPTTTNQKRSTPLKNTPACHVWGSSKPF